MKANKIYAIYFNNPSSCYGFEIVGLYTSRKLAKENLNDLCEEEIKDRDLHIGQMVIDYRLNL